MEQEKIWFLSMGNTADEAIGFMRNREMEQKRMGQGMSLPLF